MKRKMLHLLNWKIQDIINELPTIQKQGFTHIITSPVQAFKDNGNQWFWVYQNTNFKIGNKYGTREELVNLCEEAHKLNIKVVVDVLCTHVASKDNNKFEPHESVNLSNYRFRIKNMVKDWSNRFEITHYCAGLPALDTWSNKNYDLVNGLLYDLVVCGIDGVRIDEAKHIATPKEGCRFFKDTFMKHTGLELYGEVIFVDKETLEKYTPIMTVITDNGHGNKNVCLSSETHDNYYNFDNGHHKTIETLIGDYNYIVQNTDCSSVLFFVRPFDNTWKCERIRQINNKY